MSGRTTRIIDKAIQRLFNGERVAVYDHYDTLKTHNLLAKKIERRLQIEHYGVYERLEKVRRDGIVIMHLREA